MLTTIFNVSLSKKKKNSNAENSRNTGIDRNTQKTNLLNSHFKRRAKKTGSATHARTNARLT